MDVCTPGAMEMRSNKSCTIEGESLSYLELQSKKNFEWLPAEMMTFPILVHPQLCDRCMICEQECPVSALAIYEVIRSKFSLTKIKDNLSC